MEEEHNLGKPEESIRVPEVPNTEWTTLMLLQRHGRYDNRPPAVPGQPTEEERHSLGRLTPEGEKETAKRTRERLEAILENDPEHPEYIDFLLVSSPTFWFDDERLGQRARETAEIIAQEILGELDKRELPRTQLLNLLTKKGAFAFRGGISRPEERLGEALMFQVPEFTTFLREQYGGQGLEFWRNFFRDTHREKREETGAEGPGEIADRMDEFLNVAARFARFYHQHHPGRRLVIWMVAHGDSLTPYVQRVIGAPEEDSFADYNDGIGISTDAKGQTHTEIGGKEYLVPFKSHGRPSISDKQP